MSIISIVMLALTFLASLVASWLLLIPFFEERESSRGYQFEGIAAAGDLLQRRELLFEALEELEFDLRSSRIDQEAYQLAKAELSAEAAKQLEKIDGLSSKLANDSSDLS